MSADNGASLVEATLYIDTWSSECSACHGGADPNEEYHTTLLGYGEHGDKGCGAKFVKLATHYNDIDGVFYDTIKSMRPDLPFDESSYDVFSAPELGKGL